MKLIIDCREKAFVKTYADIDKSLVQVKALDLGDFQVCDDNLHPYLIVERKTVADLKASIIDGRYREQKDRLLCFRKEHPKTRTCYILEGAGPFDTRDKLLNGALINSILRDQISFFFSKTQEETWELMWDIFQRINKDSEMFQRSYNYAPSMTTHMDSIYKEKITPKKSENISAFVLQLTCIEGIGTRKAYDIIDTLKVNNIYDLCKCSTEEISKVKGVGQVLARKIKLIICGFDKQETETKE